MQTYTTVLKLLVTAGIALAVFAVGTKAFFDQPTLVDDVAGRLSIVMAFVAAITAIFWHGINRLNSMDDLDSLKAPHRKLIREKVDGLKRALHLRVMILILSAAVIFFLIFLRAANPAIDWILRAAIPLVFSLIWYLTSTYPSMFFSIESLRHKTADLRRKEKARQQLISSMKKERAEQPIISDEHLEKYKRLAAPNQPTVTY